MRLRNSAREPRDISSPGEGSYYGRLSRFAFDAHEEQWNISAIQIIASLVLLLSSPLLHPVRTSGEDLAAEQHTYRQATRGCGSTFRVGISCNWLVQRDGVVQYWSELCNFFGSSALLSDVFGRDELRGRCLQEVSPDLLSRSTMACVQLTIAYLQRSRSPWVLLAVVAKERPAILVGQGHDCLDDLRDAEFRFEQSAFPTHHFKRAIATRYPHDTNVGNIPVLTQPSSSAMTVEVWPLSSLFIRLASLMTCRS